VKRLLQAVWSALWLAALLIAPPVALAVWFGNPLPRHLPDRLYLHEWIISCGLLAAWGMWLGLVALIAWHIRLAVRPPHMPDLRMANPPEGLLAGLVGAAVVAFTTVASRGSAAPVPPVPAVAVPQPILSPDLATPTVSRDGAGPGPAGVTAVAGPPTGDGTDPATRTDAAGQGRVDGAPGGQPARRRVGSR
jgi:hypothetical protein